MRQPNFFLVGAQKAGTTSLEFAMRQHPEVFISPIKEPNHFCTDIHKDLGYRQPSDAIVLNLRRYLSKPERPHVNMQYVFEAKDYEALFRDADGFRAVGECSTTYLYSKTAPENIRQYAPAAKIIISLRDPVRRMKSHHAMATRIGYERRSLEEAVSDEIQNLDAPWVETGPYLGQSLYADGVKRYTGTFRPDNVLLMFFEDFISDPHAELEKLRLFLELAPFDGGIELEAANPGAATRSSSVNAVLHRSGLKRGLRSILPPALKRAGKKLLYRDVRKGNTESHVDLPLEARSLIEKDMKSLSDLGFSPPRTWTQTAV